VEDGCGRKLLIQQYVFAPGNLKALLFSRKAMLRSWRSIMVDKEISVVMFYRNNSH